MITAPLYLDDVGLGLLGQLAEAWEAFHVTRDEIGDVTYGGYRRESELITRDIELDDIIIEFATHVSFLYDNQGNDTRTKTPYLVSDALLDGIANMEFEQREQGSADEDTLTEIAIEALIIQRACWPDEPRDGMRGG